MIAVESVAVVLLAAGLSTRFGPSDKLAAPLDGLPLGLHAAQTLGQLPFLAKIAVTRPAGPDFAAYGFETILNHDPGSGQSGSIRLGVARARLARPEAVLIALADMPFITTAHVTALLARFEAEHRAVGSTHGTVPTPPAVFGAAHFDALEALTGDAGARSLLRSATLILAPPGELADIDTPTDLRTLQ
jgi:molybdenum cofactor cytidylyltransferase